MSDPAKIAPLAAEAFVDRLLLWQGTGNFRAHMLVDIRARDEQHEGARQQLFAAHDAMVADLTASSVKLANKVERLEADKGELVVVLKDTIKLCEHVSLIANHPVKLTWPKEVLARAESQPERVTK